jgi:phage terminase large subunit GpA-like protein
MPQPWIERANSAVRHGLSALQVLPPMLLSKWAAEYFYLSKESSYTEGRWQAYPYQPFILDCFGNDDIEIVDVRKSARTGYTKMLLAASAFFTVYRRRNQAIWQPTDSDAQEFVETEYNPMLRDVAPIKDIFPHLEKKHAHNKNDFKKFSGCVTYVKGGSSARNYRRISVDVAILDEVDGFDKDIDQEGSPRKLSKKRTEGATFPKQIVGSTPKLKYLSEIDAAVEEADAVYTYRVPCPHCGARQTLEFGGKDKAHGLKWIDKDHETAAYSCISCAVLFTQAEYLSVWDQGRWEDGRGNWYDEATGKFRNPEGDVIRPPKHLAIDKLWSIYSPQTTWPKIVKEFLDAAAKAKHGDKSDLKVFVNTTLGESYEEEAEKTDASELKKRAEDFPLQVVQRGGLLLQAGVDVQKDRFEVVVWAFGRGEEMWTVDYQVIEANPAIESEWHKLDPFLLRSYPHVSGARLSIDNVALDTGGHWTHEAYNYVRDRRTADGWVSNHPVKNPPKLYATKGSSTAGQKIHGKSSLVDVNQRGKVIKNGLRLYLIGTDTAKDLIFNRLQVAEPGPGYVHLSKHLPDAFFEHITNEVRVTKHTAKGQFSLWTLRRSGARNECLDCTVMTLFCADKVGLQKKSNKEWDLLESIIQPNQNDLFSIEQNPDLIAPAPKQALPKPIIKPVHQPLASDTWSSRL